MSVVVVFSPNQRGWAQIKLDQFEERLNSRQDNSRQISTMLEMATVWVLAESYNGRVSAGTGFIVAPGYAVTNAHVIWETPRKGAIYIINNTMPLTEVQVVDAVLDHNRPTGFGGRDLALLKFKVQDGLNLPVLSFNLEVSKMDRVGAWGYPAAVAGLDQSMQNLRYGRKNQPFKPAPVVYTEGTVSTFLDSNYGKSLVHTASISGGNSGGPLINSDGEVVGINTWYFKDADTGTFFNIAQFSNDIVGFLIKNGLSPRLAQGQVFAANTNPKPTIKKKPPSQIINPPPAPRLKPGDNFKELENFFVQVPVGWAVEKEESDFIILSSLGTESLAYLGVFPTAGLTTREIASILAKQMDKADPPVKDEKEQDVYISYGKINNSDSVLVVSGDQEDDKFAVIMLTGDFTDPGFDVILNSVGDKE
jgi:S1-C subfamily serine protease